MGNARAARAIRQSMENDEPIEIQTARQFLDSDKSALTIRIMFRIRLAIELGMIVNFTNIFVFLITESLHKLNRMKRCESIWKQKDMIWRTGIIKGSNIHTIHTAFLNFHCYTILKNSNLQKFQSQKRIIPESRFSLHCCTVLGYINHRGSGTRPSILQRSMTGSI